MYSDCCSQDTPELNIRRALVANMYISLVARKMSRWMRGGMI